MIAAGGGIGGGGIIVPLYMLLLGFRPRHAIPLSNVTICGGSIANAIFNVRKRHPRADRPVIDWDIILIMEPSTIVGAVLGSFLSKVLDQVEADKEESMLPSDIRREESLPLTGRPGDAPRVERDFPDREATEDGLLHERSGTE